MTIKEQKTTWPDIKTPGLLVGEAGSGRTTILYKLAMELVEHPESENLTPIYIEAPEFLSFAHSQRTLYDFVAAQLLDAKNKELIKKIKSLDMNGLLIILVDNLDRLSRSDQASVLIHLVQSPNMIISALPWQVDWIREKFHPRYIQKRTLVDLTSDEQGEILSALACENGPIDISLATIALKELSWLASLPMGVVAIYAQVKKNVSNPALICLSLLEEAFKREGNIVKLSAIDAPSGFALVLILAGRAAGNALNQSPAPTQITDLYFTKNDIAHVPEHESHWKSLSRSRLFIAENDGEKLYFGSQALRALIALAVAHEQLILIDSARTSTSPLVQQVLSLSDALLEWQNLVRSGLIELSPAKKRRRNQHKSKGKEG